MLGRNKMSYLGSLADRIRPLRRWRARNRQARADRAEARAGEVLDALVMSDYRRRHGGSFCIQILSATPPTYECPCSETHVVDEAD